MKPVLKLRTFGSPGARFWLILPVDAEELTAAEEVYTAVVANSTKLVYLLAAAVEDWNRDLSLWEAPPVFGKVPFSGGAEATRNALLPLLPEDKTLLLGGYSLAGLFALWTGYETDRFAGVAAKAHLLKPRRPGGACQKPRARVGGGLHSRAIRAFRAEHRNA